MPRALLRAGTALVLQALALVLAHELVFMARYGSRYGEALAHAGHGETWSNAVDTTLAITALLAIAGFARLARLTFLVRRGRSTAGGRARGGRPLRLDAFVGAWARTGAWVAVATLVLLTVQENVEHGAIGGALPGLGILLSPEYPGAVAITVGVALLVGFVTALFEWGVRALISELRAARASLPRHDLGSKARVPRTSDRPSDSILGRRSGLRAPPLPVRA
jgi:hypothetical protein